MIKVLVCDDQEMVREGLRAILANADGIEVAAVASDGAEALELLEQHRIDVVLMDLKMPVMTGVKATGRIIERHAGVRILVLTTFDGDEWIYDAIRAGASGYLLKDAPAERLVEAIKGTAKGESHVAPTVATKLFDHVAGRTEGTASTELSELSRREREVLSLLALGLSNAQIAKRLFLSEGTVRNYLSVVFEKLDVSDRTQAALIAQRHGLDRLEQI